MIKMSGWPVRYGGAVLAVAGCMALVSLPGIGDEFNSVLYLAVLLVAWYGGLGPGLLATTVITILAMIGQVLRPDFTSWQLVRIPLFTTGGVLIALLGEALHAARRRVEVGQQRLSAVLTSIADAVVATDDKGRVTFLNPKAESLCGWTQADAVGRSLRDVLVIVDEETRRPLQTPVERVLAEDRPIGLANPTILIAKNGNERPIDDSAAPVRDQRGGLAGVVMVFRDITERRKAEKDREQLFQEVRANNQRKDEFLAMLAHELRNPLAAISSAVTVTQQGALQEHIEWSMEVINRQLRHLSRLIDDLLDVSRITRGKIVLRRSVVEASPILDGALETIRPLIEDRKHTLDLALDRGNLWVNVDPTRLEQIVVNLLSNAAKFSKHQSHIWLAARRQGREIAITVRDAGIGIPPERLQEIFELFAQGDRSLARSEGGLGIGLTVVKRLVEMHGGSVTAASEGAGKGSEFTVRLPAAERPSTAPQPAAGSPSEPSGRTSRILVVDDNVDTASGMARLLKLRGHDVAVAHTGPEAIETAARHRPEFVLLDIGLPGMDGYEVATRLREEASCRETVIVAASGYGQEEDRRRSLAAGFDYHLVKPIDQDVLLTILSR
jgi:PAS domain S-box-containing protein